MKKQNVSMFLLFVVLVLSSSCTSLTHVMREPNTRVNLNKSDFILSEQVSAEAESTTILGIDWSRLLSNKSASVDKGGYASISIASIPVIGNYIADRTANYSLYELMNNNLGYDVVFYPQYETKVIKPILGLGCIVKITKVKTTARLGKLAK